MPTAADTPAGASRLELAEAARRPVAEVLARLDSGEHGISATEASVRLAAVGANVIHQQRITAWTILGRQLRNPLLLLLLAAAMVSALTGDPTNAGIVSGIVALSVGLGFSNEYRSAQAAAAMHRDIRYEALAWRDGAARRVNVAALVPGDVVALGVGDVVPADLRLIAAEGLECDESVLTGESQPAAARRSAPHRRDASTAADRSAVGGRGPDSGHAAPSPCWWPPGCSPCPPPSSDPLAPTRSSLPMASPSPEASPS